MDLNLNPIPIPCSESIPEPIPMLESIPIPEPIPESIPEPIPEPIPGPIPESILEPILIPEPIPESIPEPIPISEPIPESIPETDSGPTIRNRFQKTAELAGIDSDKNFIFPSLVCIKTIILGAFTILVSFLYGVWQLEAEIM